MDETDGHGLMRRIDGYCERTGPELWAEPLNAVTNIAFILAGVMAIRMARAEGQMRGDVVFLSGNAIVVGIGSFLFHTFATVWAAIMDTTPILVFILAYFAVAMRKYVGLSLLGCAAATAVLLVEFVIHAAAFRTLLYPIVGGSVSYFPALLMLFVVGGWLAYKRHPSGLWIAGTGVVFAVSLTFRAIDEPVCQSFAVGTHFLWHIFNGLVLWLLLRTLIRHGGAPVFPRPERRGGSPAQA
jgi:hypothetical protein